MSSRPRVGPFYYGKGGLSRPTRLSRPDAAVQPEFQALEQPDLFHEQAGQGRVKLRGVHRVVCEQLEPLTDQGEPFLLEVPRLVPHVLPPLVQAVGSLVRPGLAPLTPQTSQARPLDLQIPGLRSKNGSKRMIHAQTERDGNLFSQLQRPLPELDRAHLARGETGAARSMPFAAPPHDKLADAAPGLEKLAAIGIRRPQDKQLLVDLLDALAERVLALV